MGWWIEFDYPHQLMRAEKHDEPARFVWKRH